MTSDSKMRSVRYPIFLDNQVNEILANNTIPKVNNLSDAYKFLVELGINAFMQYKHMKDDPEKAKGAAAQLEFLLSQDDFINALGNLPEHKYRGIAMAVKMMEAKRDL